MRISRLVPIWIVLGAAACFAQTQPSAPVSPEQEKNVERLKLEAEVVGAPMRKFDSIQQVVRMARQDNQLVATTPLNDLENGGDTRLFITGMPGVITIRPLRASPTPEGEALPFNYFQRDLTPAGSLMIHTTLSSIDGRVQLSRESEDEAGLFSVQLIQDAVRPDADPSVPLVRLYIRKVSNNDDSPPIDIKLEAGSFGELCARHPREVATYVRPIVRDFKQESSVFAPDPRAAWQVLGEHYTPTPDTMSKVNATVAKLDAEDFQIREAALSELQQIGQPAALMLMHADRTKMSPEKQSSIDTFLAPYLPLSPAHAKKLREDKQFLFDCLSIDSTALQTLAWEQLKSITRTTIPFDPNADAAQRDVMISQLRDSLLPPTTQP